MYYKQTNQQKWLFHLFMQFTHLGTWFSFYIFISVQAFPS